MGLGGPGPNGAIPAASPDGSRTGDGVCPVGFSPPSGLGSNIPPFAGGKPGAGTSPPGFPGAIPNGFGEAARGLGLPGFGGGGRVNGITFPPFGAGGGRGFAGGGLLGSPTPSKALVQLLERDASHYAWVAATVGSNNAAGYQLATGDPIMALGGFNGSDLHHFTQFEADVAAHKVHYFIGGAGIGMANEEEGGRTTDSSWVASHYTVTTVGSVPFTITSKMTRTETLQAIHSLRKGPGVRCTRPR